MRAITLGAAIATLALAGCATRETAPVAPVPVPEAPPPAPPAPPPPPPQDWRDIALSPGDWTYRPGPPGPAATFGAGAPAFTLRCDPAARQVVLERAGASPGARLTVRTSFGERSVPAGSALPAADPFLDQIVFSRGRFTVSAEGLPMLIIPSWPEPARTIEDCRG